MAATPEYYDQILESLGNPESLTVLVVAGASSGEVAADLGLDLSSPLDLQAVMDRTDGLETTVWGLVDVPGGVLAIEESGYGDPPPQRLRAMSRRGAAALVRGNIDGAVRFGAARAGDLVFDADDFYMIEDPESTPVELRPLLDLVWLDLDAEIEAEDDGPAPWSVGLAMAEIVTGIELRAEHLEAVDGPFYRAPYPHFSSDG